MVGDEAKYSTVHLMNCRVRGIAKASQATEDKNIGSAIKFK
jgi:hypothetical protein